MFVGTVEFRLVLREAQSLKDKRRVIKSLKDRLAHRFNVSVAEVDHQDNIQQATLGVAMVGNSRQFINSALSKVIEFVRFAPGGEMVDHHLEIM